MDSSFSSKGDLSHPDGDLSPLDRGAKALEGAEASFSRRISGGPDIPDSSVSDIPDFSGVFRTPEGVLSLFFTSGIFCLDKKTETHPSLIRTSQRRAAGGATLFTENRYGNGESFIFAEERPDGTDLISGGV